MKKILNILLFSSFALSLYGQLKVIVNVPFPYPQNLEQLAQSTTMNVLNNTQKSYDTYLKVSLEGLSGEATGLRGDNYPSARKIHEVIPPGGAFYTFEDALPYKDNAKLSDFTLKYTPAQKAIAYDQRKLIPGTYRLCVQAFDYLTDKPISSSMAVPTLGDGCQDFLVNWFEPPQLLQPMVFGNTKIAQTIANDQNQIDFAWTIDPSSSSQMIEYTLELRKFSSEAEMTQFLNMGKPHDAFDAGYLTLKNIKNISTTNYNTIDDNLNIKSGDYIAVRVVADGGDVYFKNKGRSDVLIIHYGGLQPNMSNNNGGLNSANIIYPLADQTLPFIYVPIVSQINPADEKTTAMSAATKFLDLTTNSEESCQRNLPWPNGPKVFLKNYLQSKNLKLSYWYPDGSDYAGLINLLDISQGNGQKFLLKRGHKYGISTKIDLTIKGKVEKFSPTDFVGKSFTAGMPIPKLALPEDKKEIKLGDKTKVAVELNFETGEAPVGKLLPEIKILNIDNPVSPTGVVQSYLYTMEKCVVQVSKKIDFSSDIIFTELRKIQKSAHDTKQLFSDENPVFENFDFTKNEEYGARNYNEDDFKKAVYKSLKINTPELTEGTYYWRVAWLTEPEKVNDKNPINLTANNFYHTSPIWQFKISKGVPAVAEVEQGCKSPCLAAVIKEEDKKPSTSPFLKDDVVKIGKFLMQMTEVTKNGDNYSGKGSIVVNFLWKAHINVVFQNIKINDKKVVYEGVVKAEDDNSQIVNTTRAGLITNKIGITDAQMAELNTSINQSGRLLSSMINDRRIGMPLGFKTTVLGDQLTLGIIAMNFYPTNANLEAAVIYDHPSLNGWLALAADVCFHPDGIDNGFTVLKNPIKKDFSFGEAGRIHFTPYAVNGNDTTGCFVRWYCGNWNSMQIDGYFEFNQDHLVPEDANGQPIKGQSVVADFRFKDAKGANWLSRLNFKKPFQINSEAMKGWSFQVNEAWFDESEIENRPGMLFPSDYAGKFGKKDKDNKPLTNDATWQGLTISSVVLKGPKDMSLQNNQRFTTNIDTMLFDKTGVYLSLFARDIITTNSGGLVKNWPFSLDTLQFKIAASEVRRGYMAGTVAIPPAPTSPLRYKANLHAKASGFQFVVHPTNNNGVDIPLWSAKMNIARNSMVGINIGDMPDKNKDYNEDGAIDEYDNTDGIYARINGRIALNNTFNPSLAGYAPFKLDSVKVENLVFQSWGKIIDCDRVSYASPSKKVNGFDANITSFRFVNRANKANLFDLASNGGSRVGFEFGVDIGLVKKEKDIFKATTTFAILGRINPAEKNWGVEFAGMDMDELHIKGQVSEIVTIEGGLKAFNKDAKFGTGFKGHLGVKIKKVIDVNATVQFGEVNDINYWFVDATGVLPGDGVKLFAGVNVKGIGGSVCYNMSAQMPADTFSVIKDNALVTDVKKPGAVASGITYVPVPNAFGFSMRCVIGPEKGNAYRGKVEIGAGFTNEFKLLNMYLRGELQIMPEEGKKESPAWATVNALLDFQHDFYHANASVYVKYEPFIKGAGVGYLAGQLDIVSDAPNNKWHIWFNHPTNRNGLKVLDLAQLQYYLCTGNDLPPMPPIPADILNSKAFAGMDMSSFERSIDPSAEQGAGLMFGVDLHQPDEKFNFLCFYAKFGMHLGFDIALKKMMPNPQCKQSIGVNGWYAMGQVYARMMGAVGIHVDLLFIKKDIEILALEAAAILQAGLPNPTFVDGAMGIYYNILDGLVEGNVNFKFNLGSKPNPACTNPGSPLAGIKLIQDSSPKGGATNVATNITPNIVFNMKLNQPFEVKELTPQNKMNVHTYRIAFRNFTIREGGQNGAILAGKQVVSDDRFSIVFAADKWYKPNSDHFMHIEVYGEELLEGQWVDKSGEGKEELNISFKTGAAPKTIANEDVAYSYPQRGQRYFLQNETDGKGVMKFKMSGVHLALAMPPMGGKNWNNTSFNCRLISVPNKDTLNVPITIQDNVVQYTMPKLQNNTIYCFQITKFSITNLFSSYSFNNANLFAALSTTRVDANSGGQKVGTSRQNKVEDGSEGNSGNVKLVYEYYFKTSTYNTVSDKIAAMQSPSPTIALSGYDDSYVTTKWSGELVDIYDALPYTYTINGGANINDGKNGNPSPILPLISTTSAWNVTSWNQDFADTKVYNLYKDLTNAGVPTWSIYLNGSDLAQRKKIEWNGSISEPIKANADYQAFTPEFNDPKLTVNGFYWNYWGFPKVGIRDYAAQNVNNDLKTFKNFLSNYINTSSGWWYPYQKYGNLSQSLKQRIATTLATKMPDLPNAEYQVKVGFKQPPGIAASNGGGLYNVNSYYFTPTLKYNIYRSAMTNNLNLNNNQNFFFWP
jgi:hypothetical protein